MALGLLMVSDDADLREAVEIFSGLTSEQRGTVLGGLTVLSLLKPLPEMPDPSAAREHLVRLIERLEAVA